MTNHRPKIALILITFAICGTAAIVEQWRQAQRTTFSPRQLYDVVLAHATAFSESDYPRAYRHVSNTVQEKYNLVTYSEFAQREHPELRRAERIEFGPIRRDGRRAIVPTYFFRPSGDVIPCAYSLVREADAWKIDDVRVFARWPSEIPKRGIRL